KRLVVFWEPFEIRRGSDGAIVRIVPLHLNLATIVSFVEMQYAQMSLFVRKMKQFLAMSRTNAESLQRLYKEPRCFPDTVGTWLPSMRNRMHNNQFPTYLPERMRLYVLYLTCRDRSVLKGRK